MFSENNENINEEKNDEVMDTVVTEEYGAEQIQVLKGLEAVRKMTRYVYRLDGTERSSPPCI